MPLAWKEPNSLPAKLNWAQTCSTGAAWTSYFLARNQMFNQLSVCVLACYVFRSSFFTFIFLWQICNTISLRHMILILILCNTMGKIVLHASPTSNFKPLSVYFSKKFLEKEIYLVLRTLFYINQYNLIFLLLFRLILKRFHYPSNFLGIESRCTIPT